MARDLQPLCPALEVEHFSHRAKALLGSEEAHVLHPLVVVALAQVAVPGIAEDHHHELAGSELARRPECAEDGGARRPAAEDPFLAGEAPGGQEGVAVAHVHDLVDHREVEGPDHEVVPDTFDPVGARARQVKVDYIAGCDLSVD